MSDAPVVKNERTEYKDEQLLARLIGAAVLLAIAVIVLPFVLDGAGSQREYEYAETFPVQPERPVAEKSYSSRQPLPEGPKLDDIPVITSTAPAGIAALDSAVGASSETGATETTQQVAENTASSSPQSNTASAAGQNIESATIVGGANQQIMAGYNIQVASFVKDENALKLLNRLRQENLPAYVNRVDGKKRAIFRVFVGPLSNQVDALALKNRIDRGYRVDSIMVTRN